VNAYLIRRVCIFTQTAVKYLTMVPLESSVPQITQAPTTMLSTAITTSTLHHHPGRLLLFSKRSTPKSAVII